MKARRFKCRKGLLKELSETMTRRKPIHNSQKKKKHTRLDKEEGKHRGLNTQGGGANELS